ncbi:unnamed protein product, partial [Urochloa humidicola]
DTTRNLDPFPYLPFPFPTSPTSIIQHEPPLPVPISPPPNPPPILLVPCVARHAPGCVEYLRVSANSRELASQPRRSLPAADPEEGEGKSSWRPAMDAGGGLQAKGINPECPNAANPFHRCAEYCPVPPPRGAAKPSPHRPRPAQNGTRNGDGAKRVVPAAAVDGSEEEEEAGAERAVNPEYYPFPAPKSPPPPPPAGTGHASQNGTAHRDEEECEITAVDEPEEASQSIEESPEVGGSRRRSPRPPAKDGDAGGERQWQAVNPDCPNAVNPFHRCAEYCPVPVPRGVAKHPPRGYEESTHSDPGGLSPRPRRRDKGGGSGGLPLYVFLREGSDGEGKKVDPKCPNAANPFHECGEHCGAKMQQVVQHKGITMQSPRKKAGKDVPAIPNWKVDPRCPNASNPFHMCAQYCFDHLNETAQTSKTKSDKKKGKTVSKEVERGETNPDCANASNPYHKCGEQCKRKGGR